MKNLIKIILKTLLDREADFERRMFNLVMVSGTVTSFFGVWICVLAHVSIWGVLSTFLIFVSTLVFLIMGNLYPKKIYLCKRMICIGIVIIMPVIWLTSGALNSGVNVWLAYGLVFIALLYSGKFFGLFSALYMILVTLAFVLSFVYPEYIFTFDSKQDAYISIFGSLLTVSMGLIITLKYYKRIYLEVNMINIEQQRKLEEINASQKSFFANISHEIRTPINTIIGLNEMNLRENLSADVQENCENIQGASRMLLSLINDILDISKIQSGKMEIVPEQYEIATLLSDIVNMIWVRAHNKGLEFKLDVSETIPRIMYGDSIRIKQILINLLTNAVKYTEKGSVTLEIKGEIINHKNIRLSMSVRDTGIGIKREDIGSLFDSFKRVDQHKTSNIEGTGLGLAISGQLAELMGGQIKVDSIYQQGSSFTLIIDQKIIDAAPVGAMGKNIKKRNQRKQEYVQSFEAPDAKILIVDDNRMNQIVATKLLSATKIQMDVADSGKQCLEMTFQNHYDAILMDHVMPGMDGIETLLRIRNQEFGRSKDVPIIALTANAGTGMEDFYKSKGFQGYLVKPISGILLEEMLVKFLPKELVHKNVIFEEDDDDDLDIQFSRSYRKKLIITVDSVCDLPPDYMKMYGILCMPYYVETENGRFKEGEEIWTENLFEYMKKNGGVIKSSPPLIEEYEKFFGRALGEADQIIHISMTSKASEGYERALKASESFNNVYVVDSGHLSTGAGIMALVMAKRVMNGYVAEEILSEVEDLKKRISTTFILKSTNYLCNSGRMSKTVSRLCNAFSIYPSIKLKNGYLKISKLFFGNTQNAYKRYIAGQLANCENMHKEFVFLICSGCTIEERKMFREEIEKYCHFENIVEHTTGSAISTNCGPGTMGIMFIRIKE